MISLDDIMAFQEHAAFDQRAEIIESVCTCAGIPPLKVNIHE